MVRQLKQRTVDGLEKIKDFHLTQQQNLFPLLKTGLDFIRQKPPLTPDNCDGAIDKFLCSVSKIKEAITSPIDIFQDKCNFAIFIDTNNKFFKIPGFHLAFRYSTCREPQEQEPLDRFRESSQSPAKEIVVGNGSGFFGKSAFVSVATFRENYYEFGARDFPQPFPLFTIGSDGQISYPWRWERSKTKVLEAEFPYINPDKFPGVACRVSASFVGESAREILPDPVKDVRIEEYIVHFDEDIYNSPNTQPIFVNNRYIGAARTNTGIIIFANDGFIGAIVSRLFDNLTTYEESDFSTIFGNGYGSFTPDFLKTYKTIKRTANFSLWFRPADGFPGATYSYKFYERRDALTLVVRGKGTPSEFIPPPPPPPPMACCPGNDELLLLLLKRVDELSKVVGVEEFPANLPASLLRRKGIDSGNAVIPNLAQMNAYFLQRFDEVMGQFEIDIEIEDTDLAQAGNQSQRVKLPNLAEAIAEIFTLNFQSYINSELLINIANRTLIESGQIKQQDFKNHAAIQTIIDFLGYNYTEENREMPLSFTPGKDNFSEMLKEYKQNVPIQELREKNRFPAQMLELLQAAAIIRAVFWKPIDPKGDLKGTLKKEFLSQLARQKELKGTLDLDEIKELIKQLSDIKDT